MTREWQPNKVIVSNQLIASLEQIDFVMINKFDGSKTKECQLIIHKGRVSGHPEQKRFLMLCKKQNEAGSGNKNGYGNG